MPGVLLLFILRNALMGDAKLPLQLVLPVLETILAVVVAHQNPVKKAGD